MNRAARTNLAVGLRGLAAACCAWLAVGAAQAQVVSSQTPEESVWLAVSDHALDGMRGGFDFGGGLVVSFGISRVVYINDQLVSTTAIQAGDIAKLTQAQLAALGQQLASQIKVVQNGPGNTVAPGAEMVPLAAYIQNTLDNQKIRTETVIQATTNALSILKSMNLQQTLNDALAKTVGNR
ncbi:MAG: hypothetical protein KGL90_12715 [Burkholderiales bacterium]|nr:hypothetical protein [Burkholderiales bacterium]